VTRERGTLAPEGNSNKWYTVPPALPTLTPWRSRARGASSVGQSSVSVPRRAVDPGLQGPVGHKLVHQHALLALRASTPAGPPG